MREFLIVARERVGGQAREKFGGASRNRDTKNNFGLKNSPAEGGAEGKAGKNFLSPSPFPFLPALPLNFFEG